MMFFSLLKVCLCVCVLNQLMKVLFRRNLYISGSDSVMILGEQQLSSHTTNSCDCDTQVQAHQTTPASVKGELDGAGRRSGLSGDTTCDLWGGGCVATGGVQTNAHPTYGPYVHAM